VQEVADAKHTLRFDWLHAGQLFFRPASCRTRRPSNLDCFSFKIVSALRPGACKRPGMREAYFFACRGLTTRARFVRGAEASSGLYLACWVSLSRLSMTTPLNLLSRCLCNYTHDPCSCLAFIHPNMTHSLPGLHVPAPPSLSPNDNHNRISVRLSLSQWGPVLSLAGCHRAGP